MKLGITKRVFDLLRGSKDTLKFRQAHDSGDYFDTADTEFAQGYYQGVRDMLKAVCLDDK